MAAKGSTNSAGVACQDHVDPHRLRFYKLPLSTVVAAVRDSNLSDATSATVVLAGGCFWGVQGVFQHVKGVISAVSGYAGGEKHTAHYEIVGTDTTGHAEAVQVTYIMQVRPVAGGTAQPVAIVAGFLEQTPVFHFEIAGRRKLDAG